MNNKIKIVGVSNLPTDHELQENKEYLIALTGALDGIFTKSKLGEEDEQKTFHIRADMVKYIQEIGGAEIKFEQGKSPSQKLRYAILQLAERRNHENPKKFYEEYMAKIIQKVNEID